MTVITLRLVVVALCVCCVIVSAASGTGKFWVLTDIHFADDYVEGSDPATWCTEGTGLAGKFGWYSCDTPEKTLLPATLQFMNTIPVDFTLWLGDSVSSYRNHPDHDVTRKIVEEDMQKVVDEISTGMYGMPVYPVLGNHDEFPKNFIGPPPADGWYSDLVYNLWKDWLPEDALETVSIAGYYTLLIAPGYRLVAINTDYCNTNDFTTFIDQSDFGGMWAWLNTTLLAAKENNEKVLFIGHIPPGMVDVFPVPLWTHFCYKNYNQLMEDFASIITIQLYGHMHYDAFRVIRDLQGNPVSSAHLVPSVTPRSISTVPFSPPTPGKNPCVRLYTYDVQGGTFNITDYHQYCADLNESNASGNLEYVETYSLLEYYDMPDVSPTSTAELATRLQDPNDDAWVLFNQVWFDGSNYTGCDDACHKRVACAITYTNTEDFFKCTGHL